MHLRSCSEVTALVMVLLFCVLVVYSFNLLMGKQKQDEKTQHSLHSMIFNASCGNMAAASPVHGWWLAHKRHQNAFSLGTNRPMNVSNILDSVGFRNRTR